MKFNGITKKGREYLAKIQAENKPINFVKIKIGDGRLDNYDNPAELEHLINQKVEKGILTLNQEHDTVILTTNIDNVSLRTGYYPREIGVFVNDNGQEIMYYYMNDGDETSWIPPETDGPFKIELKLNLIASNAQSIIVEGVGKDLFITKEFLETNYTQKGGYTGTTQEIDDRVVSALGKEDGKFPLTEAVKGNVYYFPGNKKFYICKEAQNRRVSVPDGNFEELSIWENRKRLENLITHKVVSGTTGMTNISSCSSYITQIGNFATCMMSISVTTDYAKTTIKSPVPFQNGVYISLEDNNGDLYATNRQPVIGWYNPATQTFEVANVNAGFTVLLIGRI